MPIREKLSSIDPWLAPYHPQVQARIDYVAQARHRLLAGSSLPDVALGHRYFGLHATETGWVLREWAPHASKIFLVGEFTRWQDDPAYEFQATAHGQWEIHLPPQALKHGDIYKLHLYWPQGDGYRIPSYATYVTQHADTHDFTAQVWHPENPYIWHGDDFTPRDSPLLIYEAHVGMSSEEPAVATYDEFRRFVLPRIQASGYNAVQLMAIQEHPYYGSFGYHVSNFFAPSSRFGTPDELKRLIDTAHRMGIAVILDIVHSHAVKNEHEGLSRFDGTLYQYFHKGPRGNHDHWDSRTFDYGKPEVMHFLLSNCRYWLDEFHIDGFRFDGVTSMLYTHHGIGKAFSKYDDYFVDTDNDAIAYLTLANELIHKVKPTAITIAEDMSGMPGVAGALKDGGMGFDYRLNMGIPDIWIKDIKEKRDEDWRMSELLHELTAHRPEEQTINYAESHDQALVGDKTIIFRLADKEMYYHMSVDDTNVVVERAVALHKLIRLVTIMTHSGGYLNFMGNEFGHPEWIDFPREGNNWSYAYARRQWHLADDANLKYKWLGDFDKALTAIAAAMSSGVTAAIAHDDDHVIVVQRGEYVMVCNFHPTQSFTDYGIEAPAGNYRIVLSSDSSAYGGLNRIDASLTYPSDGQLKVYSPARTALILKKQ